MASSSSNDCNSQVKDSIDKSQPNRSSEHEETIKVDQMKAAKKLSNSIDEKAHIEDFDETQLKSLLDEAMDYKNPRDANDKSDTFKQLLKNVTEEDMKHNQRYSLGTYGLKQSNSLQNLLDDSHYQSSSHQSHTSSKKHKHRKNSTSVSTRRLEGGSLPIDMHHSSAAVQSPPDQPFLSEYKNNKKRKEKQQTVMDAGDNETDEKKMMQRHFESGSSKDGISSSYPHDGIEMKSMSYTNSVDLEVQDLKFHTTIPSSITTISSMTPAGGPPSATASIINPKVTSSMTATNSAMHSVDRIIEFPSLIEKAKSYQQPQQIIDMCSGSTINHNNNIVLTNHTLNFAGSTSATAAMQLSSNYNAVSSVINTSEKSAPKNKPEVVPTQALIANTPGTAASSKEAKSKAKRVRAAERNEKTINVESIQGFRGNDELDDLLKYIEDGDGKNQKNPKNGIVNATSEHLKKAKNNKEKVNKLKKSNSMDELWSTGRQQQQQSSASVSSTSTAANKIIQDVTLRSKSSGLTSGAKKTGEKVEKRNERRSWGTEGLRTDVEVASNSSSETVEVPVTAEPAVIIDSEFHVVMKKRKVKRKSSETGEKPSSNLQQYRRDNARTGTRNYNDRDAAKNPRNSSKPMNQDTKSTSAKNRRKSTSSMPPSDDDYNSDGGDSVQSLPIETTKTTSSQLLAGKNGKKQQQQNQQQQKPATFSYADIAKTNNPRNVSTASTEKWPSITSSTSSSSHQTINNNNDPFAIVNFDAAAAAVAATTAKNHQKTSMKMSFPELVESNNHRNKQLSSENGETTENGADVPARAFDSNNNSNDQQKISYSQSLLEPAHEIDTNGNTVKVDAVVVTVNGKATLTKSKSVDHNNLSSIEHYPALEKTAVIKTFEKVKPKPLKPVAAKKEKLLKKSASVQNATMSAQEQLNCRPAVIILNDCVKPSEGDFGGITFGFDINEGLLNGADDDASIGNSTNNNNTCDITNTNLSCNNNLTNQPCSVVEIYENFIAPVPQQIVVVENNNHMSPPQQQQPPLQLDSSNQSSNNDMGYLSSSLITNANLSPANTHKSENSADGIVDCRKTAALRIAIEYRLVLPHFISPEPVKFNQDELMSFVSEEWTKVARNGVYYNGH